MESTNSRTETKIAVPSVDIGEAPKAKPAQEATAKVTLMNHGSNATHADGALESPSSATASTTSNSKCSKCGKRAARRGCTQSACLNCCTDTACATHLEVREQAQWREQVLAGKTPLQIRAAELRSKAIPSGRFKEPGFSYLGDSVVLWDLQQYLANPTWKEEAVRKSNKRKARQRNHDFTADTVAASHGNRKKRRREKFEETMERLYQQSLSATKG